MIPGWAAGDDDDDDLDWVGLGWVMNDEMIAPVGIDYLLR